MYRERSARAGHGRVSGRGVGIRLLSALAITGLLIAGTVVSSATADDDYPTYADVLAARADRVKAEAMVKRINKVIKQLDKDAEETQAEAERVGQIYQEADQKVQEQALKATALQTQADAASSEATAARQQAAEILVDQYRSSGSDVSLDVFLNADPENLLYSIGMSSNIVGQSQGIFDQAVQLQNTAQSLSDQAAVAQTELESLRAVAEAALEVASKAADKAAAALAKQVANKAQQEQLLVELKSTEVSTQADYQKGVDARAAAAAAAAAKAGVGGGTVYSGPTRVVAGGWAYPGGSTITSGFGYRLNPFGSGRTFHLGTDLRAGCGSWIYAAHAGTVSYSGWNGVYGNFIRIDHGNGVQTEYGHIQNGGLLVHAGATVSAGDHIANVGDTGAATGCHLHFGVRIDGLVTNPVPFMSGNGVYLGQ